MLTHLSDVGQPCGTKHPIQEYVKNIAGEQAYVCYDNKIYYLMSVTTGAGDSLTCLDGEAAVCSPATFPTLPGIDQLDGQKWGGVTKDDFLAG